jgi:hypothetical protein
VLWICRKAKQSMLTDGIQGLQKLKKKGKGVTKTIIEEREKQVWRPARQCWCLAHTVPSCTARVLHGRLHRVSLASLKLCRRRCPAFGIQLKQLFQLCCCADCRCRSS